MKNTPLTINCPQCGNELPKKFRFAKLTVCTHCDSTLLLEDQAVELIGKQSALIERPSLLQLGSQFQYHKVSFSPIGMVRFAHKIGYWEEWWVIDNSGAGFWVSIDEGDFAFEKPLAIEQEKLPQLAELSLGKKIKLWNDSWQVTEIDSGICEGFKGELPIVVKVGDKIPFVHLSGLSGQLITLEYINNSIEVFQGEWVDPFEIKSI